MQSVQNYQLGQHTAARVTFMQLMPGDFILSPLQQSDQKYQLKIFRSLPPYGYFLATFFYASSTTSQLLKLHSMSCVLQDQDTGAVVK